MATKISVVRGEVPVEGALIVIGGVVGEELTTNYRGNVSFDLADGWEGFVDVLINAESLAIATIHITEGNTHVIDLGVLPE